MERQKAAQVYSIIWIPNKKTNVPDGIAVFKGVNIDKNTVPQDVVFYGGESSIRKEDRYLITDNDCIAL